MTRKQQYFMKQKLMGLVMIVISILCAWIIKGESVVVPIILVPLGIILLTEKEMCWIDDYYIEQNSKKDEELL